MHGFYRVAAVVPQLKLADVSANTDRIAELAAKAAGEGACIAVFPELCITGYTCADLFHQRHLLEAADAAIGRLAAATRELDIVIVVGAPVTRRHRLYNAAVVLQRGQIQGVVPKTFLPNYKEFYEKRWFVSGANVRGQRITVAGEYVPFGIDLLFRAGPVTIGIEICEDLWGVVPPSSLQALAGADILLNLSASNELVAKSEYRRDLVVGQSARCVAGYIYASAGTGESTTDVVYGGHAMIAENGTLLAETERFQREDRIIYGDIDVERLEQIRAAETEYADNPVPEFRMFEIAPVQEAGELIRTVDPHPFVPSDPAVRERRCQEIFNIQAAGLARRLEHIGTNTCVIGISGGLDSTLALLVVVEALKLIGGSNSDIVAVTMPGYGTSDRTYNNAVELCKILKTDAREISIEAACEQHFKDIGHDPSVHDVTYQNVQARERTQLLMDIANKEGGIVIGTGDLSEIALGWSTYNGDHMSMYAVNCSVPKTLIRYVIGWVADHCDNAGAVLLDILDTPITPELLPTDANGEVSQKTEDELGPYELHDFFLYHIVKYGAPPDKVVYLAGKAFQDKYSDAEIRDCLATFIKRFFSQQFKRSCIPDGPKVGAISLSPRGDWRMPSDATYKTWL
jgi:NAD+ synthase (glutamine-hydrolysing)